jgi:chromosome segregation protein
MRLKKLILQGFKSFADRTEFDFEAGGLTCVVGPNGCGKSNVLDAVKWVLGEQRPTSLRGREMTDVIFSGTVRRAPMGLCEATLLFDNQDRTLPIEEDLVQVTRRVFRTGETDYLLNGKAVRLKDFRDLFAGTGLGPGGYAFLEQGKIDSILASNPVDRRRVFEEAAGISRFRARKHECELKLAKLEENLARLGDVVEEVQRQVRSLRVHAGKARSHRELSERLAAVQRTFHLHRHRALVLESAEHHAALGALQADRAEAEAARDRQRVEVEAADAGVAAVLAASAELRARHAELSERARSAAERCRDQERYLQDLEARERARSDEAMESGAARERLQAELVMVRRERDILVRELERAKSLLALEVGQVQALRARGESLLERRVASEEAERERAAGAADLARQEARLDAEIHHRDRRVAELSNRRVLLAAERHELRRRVEERTQALAARGEQVAQRRAEMALAEERAARAEDEVQAAEDRLREIEAELGRRQARRDVLESLLRRQEGLDAGTKAILQEKATNPGFLPGFRGLLLDLFDVELGSARAIEAALGDAAVAIVVDRGEDALQGLRFLVGRGLGSSLFLPLDRLPRVSPVLPAGVQARDPAAAAALGALLQGLSVVSRERFEDVLAGAAAGAPLLVSEDGLRLEADRLLCLPRGGEAQGLVVLRAERLALDRRIPEIRAEAEAARARLAELRAGREEAREQLRSLHLALVREEGAAARLDQELLGAMAEIERKEEEQRIVEGEVQAAAEEAVQLRAGLERVGAERTLCEEERARLRSGLADLDAEQARHAEELDRAQSSWQAAQVSVATAEERSLALDAREADLERSLAEAVRRGETVLAEVAEVARLLARVREEAGREAARLAEAQVQLDGAVAALADREQELEAARSVLAARRQEVEATDRRLAAIQDRIAAAREREGEIRAAAQALEERVQAEHGIPLDELERACPMPPDQGFDFEQAEAEIRELRERIFRLGTVNHAAIEELEAAEARERFILAERTDLERGREELRGILRGIEAESTALFLATFGKVREHFSAIFRRLFGGGKADILLEDESRPLESGIEIKARPPGKELRSITLLSGGERSMTAVALLFAIFRAHPAPCAFLDEVDAALDEDNIERFVRMVEESRGENQFIVITHSKRTMEHADLLYGVTMPERGVSRRVAVRLEQVDEQGRIGRLEAVQEEALPAGATLAASEPLPGSAAEPRTQPLERSPAPPRPLEAPMLARRQRAQSGDEASA